MSFTWTSISVGTILRGNHWNEIKTNIDTLANNLGIATYNWTRFPVSAGDSVDDLDISELRSAVDYIYDNNVCIADHATHHVAVDNSQLSFNLNSNCSNYDSSDDITIHGSYNEAVDSSQNTGDYATHDSTVDSGDDATINDTQYSGDYSTYDSTVNNGQDTTINGTENTGYCATRYTAVNRGY